MVKGKTRWHLLHPPNSRPKEPVTSATGREPETEVERIERNRLVQNPKA
jgi:hypothetical protein